MSNQRTMKYGSLNVEVIRRPWRAAPRQPYRKTYGLKPGESWLDAPATEKQWECYVLEDDGRCVPVGAKIAQELMAEGAAQAAFVELWGGCVVVDQTLTCIAPDGRIREILDAVRERNQGRLAGFPDVIGIFPDGRVALREAKCLDAKDKLNAPQHKLADLLRQLLGPDLDLKVVEWGASVEGTALNSKTEAAIRKSGRGRSAHVDVTVSAFIHRYWEMVCAIEFDLKMSEPKGNSSGSTFIQFRSNGLPKGLSIVHKLDRGFVDLQVAGWGDRVHELKTQTASILYKDMTVEHASKSAAIRLHVACLNVDRSPDEQIDAIKEGVATAGRLQHWVWQNQAALESILRH